MRNERFEFLTKALKKFDAHFIALGHTSDDQVETVLMNLIRGTGIKGLEGISKKNERIIKGDKIFLIRPLLNFTKADTVNYCKQIGIVPRIDSTNSSLVYTRNRIREDLIPKIEREYNPQFRSAVLRLTDAFSTPLQLYTALSTLFLHWLQVIPSTAIERRSFVVSKAFSPPPISVIPALSLYT